MIGIDLGDYLRRIDPAVEENRYIYDIFYSIKDIEAEHIRSYYYI